MKEKRGKGLHSWTNRNADRWSFLALGEIRLLLAFGDDKCMHRLASRTSDNIFTKGGKSWSSEESKTTHT